MSVGTERRLKIVKKQLPEYNTLLSGDHGAEVEKRIFPRFPLRSLVCKGSGSAGKNNDMYHVSDISFSGIQLHSDKPVPYQHGDNWKGELSWSGKKCKVEGAIQWVSQNRLGVAFQSCCLENIRNFLSVKNLASNLRSLAKDQELSDMFDVPHDLALWLAADGPVEIFLWHHTRGQGYRKFQILILDKIVEWSDGQGLRSGRILSQRELKSPLNHQGQVFFCFDETIEEQTLTLAKSLLESVKDYFEVGVELRFIRARLST